MHKNIQTVVGITILILGTCINPSVAIDNTIKPISSGNTLYVGGSGEGNYSKIQDAIDNSSSGDTVFVSDDSSPYYENIFIEKSINLIGEDKYTTQINGSGIDTKSVIVVWASNVTISSFNIENSGAGPVTFDSGIYSKKDNCTFINNIITYNKCGIYLTYCRRNNVLNNIIVDNLKQGGYGIYVSGPNNVPGNHNISHNLISRSGYPIMIAYTSNNEIYRNEIINSTTHTGIWAQFCDNNIIYFNNISGNYGRGIDLYDCDNNIINNNIIFKNGLGSIPGTVGGDGISIRVGSKNNIVKNNLIKSNMFDGISFYDAGSNNQIIGNTIEDSDRWGIEVKYSSDKKNWIYNNNFINNTQYNAIDKGTNIWNNTHPIGGNYWDDYTGVDDDGDGIGDIAYNIPNGDSKDHLPLINKMGENAPYADFTYTGINLTVTLDASLSIDRDGTIISYYWEFPDGTTGTGKTINHTFPSYDNYTVYLSVTDDDGRNHTTSKIVVVEFNYSPDTPDMPSGPILVQVNESEMYSTSTNDSNDDMVQFRCDLDGNGSHNYSEWSSFVSPGETANISLMWNSGGIYVVKAQARDEHGFLSNWSDGLTVLVNIPPVQPFDPEPEDGDVNVDINADLSWNCSDPEGSSLTYNVFFEKNDETPDVLVSENQTETSFDPGTMAYGTMYYWQIVAWDNYSDSTASPVWCFVTMIESNDPPYVPGDPIPESGSTGVDVDVDLSWVGGDPDDGDTVFYDVYLEADNPDPDIKVADDLIETVFDPGTLEYGTLYYWKIVARDNHHAETIGPIWHFATEENDPPNTPSINGPDRGKPKTTYEYGFTSIDLDGDDIAEFIIKWGDDSGEETIVGPFESGEEAFANHSWDNKGTYTIQAKAKDVSGAESNWSYFNIEISRTRASSYPWYHWFLERFPLLEKLLSLLLL